MALCGCVEEPQEGAQARATVARIGDGDTLDLVGGARVRLVQVDAPELGQNECYAREALRALARLAPPGAQIEIEADPELDDKDRYGRLLRYVYRAELNVTVELVRGGAATPYFRGGDEGMYADDLLDAVDDARRERRGMWSSCRVEWGPDRAVVTRPR